jgi:glycosyltransferase involved in cell wall biosynthesis
MPSPPLRILHISTRLILGGSQENTVLSCEGQARLGHDVHLAFGPIYGPEGSLLQRVERFRTSDGRGITTHVVPHMVREVRPLADARAYRELRRLIEQIRPDVLHTHSSKAGILGRVASWRSTPRPATIHTIHGPPFMPVEGSLVRRAKIATSNTIYEVAERFAAEHCHAIVSVADAMTTQFLARGIGSPTQYTTVRSGMDVEPFLHAAAGEDRASMRDALGLAESDFVIGTIARLAQHKGHDDLLDALASDLRANPSWKLLWIGDGWWRERLLSKARSLGITTVQVDRQSSADHRLTVSPSQLILTGLVPPARIPSLLRAMDALAHPSYREGLPRTVPQALLAGVVPIAYDCDGTGEVCVDMQTGRLVPSGDIAGLREAVRWVAAHPRERAEMAQRGRDACVRDFSTRAMVEGLERVYARHVGQ